MAQSPKSKSMPKSTTSKRPYNKAGVGAPSDDVVRSALSTDLAPRVKRDATASSRSTRRFRVFREDTPIGARQIEMVMNHPDISIIEMEHVVWNRVPYIRVIYEDRLSSTDEYSAVSDADVTALLAKRDIVYEHAEKSVTTSDTDPHLVNKSDTDDEI